MAVDFKSLGKFEQGALVAGALSIILSFFPRYQSVDLGVISGGFSAWHSTGVLGMLLVIAATGIIAAKVFAAESLPDGAPWTLIALAAAGLGTIILIIRGLTWDYANPGWSGYLLFLSTIALTAFTFLLFKESGEKMPDLNKKDTPPAA
jgi:uncharacterized transporter YbjL